MPLPPQPGGQAALQPVVDQDASKAAASAYQEMLQLQKHLTLLTEIQSLQVEIAKMQKLQIQLAAQNKETVVPYNVAHPPAICYLSHIIHFLVCSKNDVHMWTYMHAFYIIVCGSSGLDNVETQPIVDDTVIQPLVCEEPEGRDSKTI